MTKTTMDWQAAAEKARKTGKMANTLAKALANYLGAGVYRSSIMNFVANDTFLAYRGQRGVFSNRA